jgi:hypothetical protein
MAVNREVYEQVGTLLQIELAGGKRQRLRSVAA